MHTNQKIPCVNGPWWFIQMWLQLYMHRIVGIDLNNRQFPSTNYKEGENRSTKAAKLMEKLLPLYQSTKTLVSSLSSFSKVSPTPSGSHIQTMII
jgi:hypothetical protein